MDGTTTPATHEIDSRNAARARLKLKSAEMMQSLEALAAEHLESPAEAQALVLEAVRGHLLSATETDRERARREARRTVDLEDAAAELRLPPQRDDYTLESYLAEAKPPKIERVESLQRAHHKIALVAAYKTGKTTLHANLTRSLVDGTKFLDQFKVTKPDGRVGIWNGEMDGDDYESYLVDAGISNSAEVAIWNLRGYRLPLLSEAGTAAAVGWLRDNSIAYWIIDPWARVCAWSGVDENVNAEVAPLLQRVDEIADEAGVGEVLVVHHAGHARGRPRGATAFPDWADGIWLYERGEDGDRETRYFRAEGRGIGVDEGTITLEDGRTVYRQASRQYTRMMGLVNQLAAIVNGTPGITTSDAQAQLAAGNSAKAEAIRKAKALDLIREDKDPKDGRRKLLYPGDESADPGLGF